MVGIVLAILLIVIGAFCMGVFGLKKGKGETNETKSCLSCLIGGIVCLIAGMLFFYFNSCRLEMYRRLDAPIVSEAQLYGYQIIGKRHDEEKSSDDEPKKSRYLIDIKDILPHSLGTFMNVEVSEEIYLKLPKGKSYLP